ncbi:MAG: hypothetical protein ACREQI_14795, partial [Candidatus Binataceae bacterium]
SRPAAIRKTEAMLAQAGFGKIDVETNDQAGLVSHLTPYELRRYELANGQVYWYYDPKICACVYEGNQNCFGRYQMLVWAERNLEQYAAQSQEYEVDSLNLLNPYYFPPPIWLLPYGGAPYPRPFPNPRLPHRHRIHPGGGGGRAAAPSEPRTSAFPAANAGGYPSAGETGGGYRGAGSGSWGGGGSTYGGPSGGFSGSGSFGGEQGGFGGFGGSSGGHSGGGGGGWHGR